jgi:WhiB family redox-sensing transcriptional regulator
MGAACKGADPTLFDATFGDLVFDALSYCDRCDVREPCLDYVMPHRTYFDGVVAGKVWRGGIEVDPALFNLEGDADDNTSND